MSKEFIFTAKCFLQFYFLVQFHLFCQNYSLMFLDFFYKISIQLFFIHKMVDLKCHPASVQEKTND